MIEIVSGAHSACMRRLFQSHVGVRTTGDRERRLDGCPDRGAMVQRRVFDKGNHLDDSCFAGFEMTDCRPCRAVRRNLLQHPRQQRRARRWLERGRHRRDSRDALSAIAPVRVVESKLRQASCPSLVYRCLSTARHRPFDLFAALTRSARDACRPTTTLGLAHLPLGSDPRQRSRQVAHRCNRLDGSRGHLQATTIERATQLAMAFLRRQL